MSKSEEKNAPVVGGDGREKRLQAISTHIDRRTCQRVVPMEVLCLGMSRTGTDCKSIPHDLKDNKTETDSLLSIAMRAALEILGYGDV